MKNEPTSEVSKNHPPAMSASPYNSYYLRGCDIAQHQPAYTACLWKISELEAGRPIETAGACNEAIRGGRCDAKGMREQERLQGVALFYFPSTAYRNRIITNITPEGELPRVTASADAGRIPFVSQDPRAANFKGRYQEYVPKGAGKSTTPQPHLPVSLPEDGYAAAINAAMMELPAAPVEATPIVVAAKPISTPIPPTPSAAPVRLADESPLQYARRMAASRTQPKE